MARARRQIIEVLPKIDVIIEILDARLPASSCNPLLQKLRGHKPCIKVLNKDDLADPEVTRLWVRHFELNDSVRAMPVTASRRATVGALPKLCRQLAPNRGVPGRTLRAMIVGIPNVGKSTLINTLAGRKMARVGDKPAITTCPQQIDLRNGIHLSDTPGLLWPDLRNQKVACRLAASGAIGESAMDHESIALFAADYLLQRYADAVTARYKLKTLPETALELVEQIGRRRGCLGPGGVVDLQRASEILLRELRAGQLGRVSLERPQDLSAEESDDDGTAT
jgi:ribosome biogenesis GTPase A